MEGQAIRGGTVEAPLLTEDQFCAVYEQLDYGTPREAQVRLANFLCSLELRCDYTVKQHIYVATDTPDRSLEKRHAKVRQSKYGNAEGLGAWDIEMAFLLTDLDVVVE